MNDHKLYPQGADFDRLILASVAKDLEPFEAIQEKLSRFLEVSEGAGASHQLESCLLRLIAEDMIAAYLLHAEPPYITVVDVNTSKLENLWFYITDHGEKVLLESLPQASGEETAVQSTQSS